MERTCSIRDQINEYFDASNALGAHFGRSENADAYAAHYTSKYLVQDTGEAIWSHMRRGFSTDPMLAYIEFWGVLQACVIHQDAILELNLSITGRRADTSSLKSWKELRNLRNQCAGHPANRSHGVSGVQRAFLGRMFGSYDRIQFEVWDSSTQSTSFPRINLRQMIDEYDVEASQILQDALDFMKSKWKKIKESPTMG